jgi:hypothetical protein
MAEIKTCLMRDAANDKWIIEDHHTLFDILRFVVIQSGDSISEIEGFVEEWKKEHGGH